MKIIMKPLEGIVVDGQVIPFFSTKMQIRKILGEPEIRQQLFYYYSGELRLEFNARDALIWAEALGGAGGLLKPEIYGISAFEASADALCSLLREKNAGEIDDSEAGYSYRFLEISVGIYRDITPEALAASAAETAELGETVDPEDFAAETKKAQHFSTIGIGIPNYYRQTR